MKQYDVAQIEPVGGHGGMDFYDFGLCQGLTNAGIIPLLYTCDETPENNKLNINLAFRGIYAGKNIYKKGIKFIYSVLCVYADILRKKIPIVHYHFFDVGVLQIFLTLIAKLLLRKVVVTVHDVEGLVSGKGDIKSAQFVYGMVDHIIVHNEFSKAELQRVLNNKVGAISVIPHGNYLHAYERMKSKELSREKIGIKKSAKIILFFGQIKGVKRLDVLIEAFSKIANEVDDLYLLIAGKVVDVPFETYQRQIDDLGLTSRCVTHIRYIQNSEVPYYYGASDAVVLPYERIYQSGVLLMAMSFGRPVVVSNIPGMTEVVTDKTNGYVFIKNDASSLAECLKSLFENAVSRDLIAENGFELMQDKYAWEHIGKLHARIYCAL